MNVVVTAPLEEVIPADRVGVRIFAEKGVQDEGFVVDIVFFFVYEEAGDITPQHRHVLEKFTQRRLFRRVLPYISLRAARYSIDGLCFAYNGINNVILHRWDVPSVG